MNGERTDVILVLPSLRGGGAERVTVSLANGLAAAGVRVTLALAQREGPYLRNVDEGVTIADLRATRMRSAVSALALLVRRSGARAVLSSMRHVNIVSALAVRRARRSGARVRLVMAEHESVRAGSARMSALTSLRIRLLARWLYPLADAVVAVSQGVSDELRAEHGDRVACLRVIPNAVLTPQFMAGLDTRPSHPWVDDATVPILMSIGRLVPDKGFDLLLEAFARVVRARPARLVLLGDGPLRCSLELRAGELGVRENVFFAGFQTAPSAWLRHAAMFVLSSRSEGLPTVLIEALGSGTRIVSTDCAFGPSQILDGGRWGTLVPVDDAQALADAIVEQLALPPRVIPDQVLAQYRVAEVTARYHELLLGA